MNEEIQRGLQRPSPEDQRPAFKPAVFLYADPPCQNSFIQRELSESASYETKIVAFTCILRSIWNANAMRTCRLCGCLCKNLIQCSVAVLAKKHSSHRQESSDTTYRAQCSCLLWGRLCMSRSIYHWRSHTR